MGEEGLKNLNLDEEVDINSMKVYYMFEFEKESLMPPVQDDIKKAIKRCADHLKQNFKAKVTAYTFDDLRESCEIGIAHLLRIKDVPNLLQDANDPKVSFRENSAFIKGNTISDLQENIWITIELLFT